MNHWKEPYKEDAELTEYIWHNYSHLMNEVENLAWRAVVADRKTAESNPKMAEKIRQLWGTASAPQFSELLEGGLEAFRKRVRERILQEFSDDISINRCDNCFRIVATPRAKQCLWCGYDWH